MPTVMKSRPVFCERISTSDVNKMRVDSKYRSAERVRAKAPHQTLVARGSFPQLIERFEAKCRNIKTLFNFDPPVTDDEVRAASLQFVRKISGFNKPSKANEQIFQSAIEEVAAASSRLLRSLETTATPKNREGGSDESQFAAERFEPPRRLSQRIHPPPRKPREVLIRRVQKYRHTNRDRSQLRIADQRSTRLPFRYHPAKPTPMIFAWRQQPHIRLVQQLIQTPPLPM